jgi:hypothetical protein
MAASELVQGRRLEEARSLYASVLEDEPWHRDALLGMAALEGRRGLYEDGLRYADRALRLDAYDAEANFQAGVLHRALGQHLDAVERFGWSARSTARRSASYVQLADLALYRRDLAEATRYARLATDYDRYSLPAYRVLAVVERLRGDAEEAERVLAQMEELDPLHHFVASERYLMSSGPRSASELLDQLRGEYPEQELLELAIAYAGWDLADDGAELLRLGELFESPLLSAWLAHLSGDLSTLDREIDPSFVFPFRAESLSVLADASAHANHWSWQYLHALNLWARDRPAEAADLMAADDRSEEAIFYAARAAVAVVPGVSDERIDREADLRRAVELAPDQRPMHVGLIARRSHPIPPGGGSVGGRAPDVATRAGMVP